MLTLAICDDNYIDIEKITKLLNEWAHITNEVEIQIKQFTSPYLLVDAVSNNELFDIFLLDILMPEMTGISLGEHLQSLLTEPLLIYLTSSEDYYQDAFRLYAFQYICKPILKNNLFPVLDKALSRFEKRKKDVFALKTAEGIVQIPLHIIIYVELLSHICHFYLVDGQHLQSLYLRTGFDSFIAPLKQHERFVKTHTSFVINLNFARKLTPKSISLTTGATIPISRAFIEQVQRQYMAHGLREGQSLL